MAPLKHTLFAVLWGATILGNIGSFMRDVASAWLVTDLSTNPAAVAMMQTAATLPVFLLAIPAGVLSDILDRRRFLIIIQVLLACVSFTLLMMAKTNTLTVETLIALTFLGGVGTALMGPTWQAIVPELVPKAELKTAVGLNSLGINIARALGPAVGGLLLTVVDDFKDAGVEVGLSGPRRCVYTGRPVGIKRVLVNLIDNAAKYGCEPTVVLAVNARQIEITVQDRGPGIAPELHEQVFAPFYRIEGSRNRNTGGVGLGLPAARAIVLEQGGSMSLGNRPGGGLEVRIMLPQG